MKRLFLVILVAMVAMTPAMPVGAEPRGLAITPIREYLTVEAGKTQEGNLTVANFTDQPMIVTLSVQQFSVADITYDYHFSEPTEQWITFESPQVTLQAGATKTVSYTVAAPSDATPGGHYFSLFASSAVEGGAVKGNMQVASLLYLTVKGALQRAGTLAEASVPWISFGGDLSLQFTVRAMGNTHFFAYDVGEVEGVGVSLKSPGTAHIILPGTSRGITEVLPSPALPGLYRLSYGYKTDDSKEVTRSQYLVSLPLWFLAIVGGGMWLTIIMMRRAKRRAMDSSRPPRR